MSTFNLKVVAPDKEILNAPIESLIVRTTSGDVGILRGHTNYIAPLAIGAMSVAFPDKTKRIAAVSGGMVKVDENGTTILTNSCEWEDEIDINRAKLAKERAEGYLENPTEIHTIDIANLKLKRALNRISIIERKYNSSNL